MQKLIRLFKLSSVHWVGWALVVIVMLLSIWIFIHARNNWETNNGEFGDLVGGTIGVGASLVAMILIIFSLNEQRKMNKQIEVHHLVESFNSRFDRFISLQKEISDVERNLSCKEHLERMWNGDEGVNNETCIQTVLDKITVRLRNKTTDQIKKLRLFCQDEDITRVSRSLNRLLSIKAKIEEMNSEAAKRVDDDWQSIAPVWKLYAGFYFGWHYPLYKSTKEDVLKNEMVNHFYLSKEGKLPEFIPLLKVFNQEDIFKLTIEEFSQQSITIWSGSAFIVNIVGLKLSGYDYHNPELFIKVKHSISPQTENQISFLELLGDEIETAFQHLIGNIRNGENISSLYQDIILDYIGKEWIYENQIELNRYPNGHGSIIYKQIDEEN